MLILFLYGLQKQCSLNYGYLLCHRQALPAGLFLLHEPDIARGYQLIRTGEAVAHRMEICHHVKVEVADKASAWIPAAGIL